MWAPLASDSAGLLAGARRAREVLRAALDSTAETASSQGIEEITRIESDSRAGIERMRVLIARASLDLKVDNVTASREAPECAFRRGAQDTESRQPL